VNYPNAHNNDIDLGSTTSANPANPENPEGPPAVEITIHRADTGIESLAGDTEHDPMPSATATSATQHGIATRLLQDHGDDLRYIAKDRTWLVWTGRWQADPDRSLIHRLILATLDRLQGGTVQGASAKVKQERQARTLNKLRTMSNLNGIADLASVLTTERVQRHDLDNDPLVVGTPNGLLNLATSQLTAPDRSR